MHVCVYCSLASGRELVRVRTVLGVLTDELYLYLGLCLREFE